MVEVVSVSDSKLEHQRRTTAPELLEERVAWLRARMRTGWRGRRIDAGKCPGIPAREDMGGNVFDAIRCEDGQVECEACNLDGLDVCWLCRGAEQVACLTCDGSGRRIEWGLDLAAYVGDEAARAISDPAQVVGDLLALKTWEGLNETSLDHWINGLCRYGRDARAIAEAAVDRLVFRRSQDAGLSDSEFARWVAREALRRVNEPTIRRAIREALVPWALGETT